MGVHFVTKAFAKQIWHIFVHISTSRTRNALFLNVFQLKARMWRKGGGVLCYKSCLVHFLTKTAWVHFVTKAAGVHFVTKALAKQIWHIFGAY